MWTVLAASNKGCYGDLYNSARRCDTTAVMWGFGVLLVFPRMHVFFR